MRRVPPGAPILTTDAMRQAEAAAFAGGVSQPELMARAGCAVAREVHRYSRGRAILVLAGPGNNGGDAYVAAQLLSRWGHDVMVAALGEPAEGAAAEARMQWMGGVRTMAGASPRPVLVDGLFGTGLSRQIDPVLSSQLEALRGAAEFCVAIDVASGLDSDRGVVLGHAVRADVTVALGALKPCHLLGEGAAWSGHVVLADLGIALSHRWQTLDVPGGLRAEATMHKFTRGLALVVGGVMPGAARLAAGAASRAGAGYVVLGTLDGGHGPLDAIVARKIVQAVDFERFIAERTVDAVLHRAGAGAGRSCRSVARCRHRVRPSAGDRWRCADVAG